MKKIFSMVLLIVISAFSLTLNAASGSYTVVKGDSLWRIAVKNQIGISELIAANPQIKDPALIYPGQKINIPNISDVKTLENEVIRLVNIQRQNRGLSALTQNWSCAASRGISPRT